MNQFEYTDKNKKLSRIRKELSEFKQDSLIGEAIQKMEAVLAQKDADDVLKIAVCGQYSSGKSTLVHALTNDSTIAIGQDVTTDKVQCYGWEGIMIVDTPGIYAGREEHDALSLDYIQKADLLIYMITIQGFTREIGANFKKLVLKKYADKTMLVMNKRNQEPAENEPNWVRDTRDFLGGDDMLKKFYFSIIDIEDYLVGVRENEPMLIAESHFEDFLEKSNAFVKERELMGRLVSRINIVDAFLSMYIEDFSRSPEKDDFTRRQKVAVQRSITAMNKVVSEEGMRMRQEVKALKHRMVGLLTDTTLAQFKEASDNAELELDRIMDPSPMASKFQEIIANLEQDMQDVEHDALAYDARISALAARFPNIDVGNSIDISLFKTGLGGVSKSLGFVTKDGLKKFVHFMGGKFKPWGAIKYMKWFKAAGPVLVVAGAILDFVQLAQDKQHQEEMEQARQEILDSFGEIESGISTQLEEIKDKEGSLGQMLNQLMQMLVDRELKQAAEREHKRELLAKFRQLKAILDAIV